jgi:hypothetical protein
MNKDDLIAMYPDLVDEIISDVQAQAEAALNAAVEAAIEETKAAIQDAVQAALGVRLGGLQDLVKLVAGESAASIVSALLAVGFTQQQVDILTSFAASAQAKLP